MNRSDARDVTSAAAAPTYVLPNATARWSLAWSAAAPSARTMPLLDVLWMLPHSTALFPDSPERVEALGGWAEDLRLWLIFPDCRRLVDAWCRLFGGGPLDG
jgi:hypothetical protein